MQTITITHKRLAIRMLRDARLRINIGSSGMLCFALTLVARKHLDEVQAGEDVSKVNTTWMQLRGWIDVLLGSSSTLEGWLVKNTIGLNLSTSNYEERLQLEAKMREARLAWLDWMVEQLEAVK